MPPARTGTATETHAANAPRAIDDPAQLARAARIVRGALERKRLAVADHGKGAAA